MRCLGSVRGKEIAVFLVLVENWFKHYIFMISQWHLSFKPVCFQEEEIKEQSPNELKPSANATESVSLLSEKERQTFLEWLFSITGGGSAPPQPEPEPVVPSHCDACSKYHLGTNHPSVPKVLRVKFTV